MAVHSLSPCQQDVNKVTRITTNKKGVFSLRPPLKHRKFARFAQEFHRNQFYFTGKMHIMKKKLQSEGGLMQKEELK
jgi:hypothetical protein